MRASKFLVVLVLGGLSQATVASVLLGTTSIGFNAQGSPNTIAGSWATNSLVLSMAVPVDYYTVELTALTGYANQLHPVSIALGGGPPNATAEIAFCSSTASCPTETYVGSTATIFANTYFGGDPRKFLDRLVLGAPTQVTSGYVYMSWEPPFSNQVTAGGSILVSAYGTVPIPPAVWLFGSALGVMGWMRRSNLGVSTLIQ